MFFFFYRAKLNTLSNGKDGVKSEYKICQRYLRCAKPVIGIRNFIIYFGLCNFSCYFRYNTWEPEENILDVRLIELYEESQKGGDVSTRRPRRRDTRYNVRTNDMFILPRILFNSILNKLQNRF